MSLQRVALLLGPLMLLPAVASAQQGPRDRQTRSMVQTAMEDYQNLEIDRAVERLNLALRGCGTSNCSPGVLARVHMSLGIVQVGGQQDAAAGTQSMARALQLDANAEPDQLLVTPEITAAFRQAQRQGGGGGGTSGGGGGTTRPVSGGGGGGGGTSGAGELLHTPAPEQLENTPLPVYVEPSGALTADHVYLHFRGTGMNQYRRMEMTRVANGYGTEVPCGQVIQGSIDYYVQAVDNGGNTVGSAGSESSPVHVPIVTRRSHPAPTLPGRTPPETCAEECPPGMSGPSCRGSGRGNRGLGDPCMANNECGEGLFCDAGACAVGEGGGGGGGGGDRPEPTDRFSRFVMDVGGGVGFAFLSGRPAYAQQRVLVDSMGRRVATTCGNYVCYQDIDPGFAPTYYLAANARYNVTRRIGIGVGVRFQFDSAGWSIEPTTSSGDARSNPFANLLMMGRLYYAVTPHGWSPTGIVAAVFAGGGVGQIEPKPALPPNVTRPGAHVLSGFGNAHFGGRVEYGMRNGFHVGAEATFQFMFPTFLFDIDVTGFVGFHL